MELYGAGWKSQFVNNDECEEYDRVLADLYDIVGSHEFPIFVDDGRGPKTLTKQETEHFAFQLDLSKDEVTLGDWPGYRFSLSMKRADLESFLKLHRKTRASKKATAHAQTACRNWLQAQLLRPDELTISGLWREANVQWNISERWFKGQCRSLGKELTPPRSWPRGRPNNRCNK